MRLLLISLVLFFSSCSEGIERLDMPDDLLSKEVMINVLGDLTKLESHIQSNYGVITEYHKVMVNSGDSLLKIHGITKEQLEQSLDYYGAQQKELEEIYSEALNRLNKELGELDESANK